MSEAKFTPWFPESVKPVRKGVYELPSTSSRCFAYWNGRRFGWRVWVPKVCRDWVPQGFSTAYVASAVEEANHYRRRPTCLGDMSEWRGLAEPPK